MTDIETRADLEEILWDFYKRAVADDLIGRFFTEVVPLDLHMHIPVITDFWESVLFGTRGYRKNVMEIHKNIHQLSAIRKEHLDRWLKLFHQTIDGNFSGEKAILMKQRATSIATLMNMKMNHEGMGNG